jgi:hypothetical protein
MQLVQLFVQMEAAPDTVDELGQLGVIQFRDVCACIMLLLAQCMFPHYFIHSS